MAFVWILDISFSTLALCCRRGSSCLSRSCIFRFKTSSWMPGIECERSLGGQKIFCLGQHLGLCSCPQKRRNPVPFLIYPELPIIFAPYQYEIQVHGEAEAQSGGTTRRLSKYLHSPTVASFTEQTETISQVRSPHLKPRRKWHIARWNHLHNQNLTYGFGDR